MKSRILSAVFSLLFFQIFSGSISAQVGEPYIHDPSTITECDGKYYTFGTGSGGLISEDGWIWRRGAVRPGGGVAPDVIRINDRYYVTYAKGGGGLSGGHASNVYVMWSKTLDPNSPDFEFRDETIVASSDGVEDCDAIDSAFLLDPTDGRLWLTYGTYFGFIRIIELDPKTGKRMPGNEPVNIAIDCEATAMMYRDGWYYLLGTHGTCCDGPNSTYNIRVGRSKKVTGPYVDHMGVPMLRGGGKLVADASEPYVGPGHFGLIDLGDGVNKFSCHYEADLMRSGHSVLAIRPLLWKDGWPVEGENLKESTYEIQSERSGYALELAVDFVRMPGGMRFFGAKTEEPAAPVPIQKLTDVEKGWPDGNIEVRMSDYMFRPHQKWTVTPVPEAGGYFGSPYFKITIEGTNRALAATAEKEVVTVPEFTGAPEQLWQIDQLTDGTYRIMPKLVPGSDEQVALTAVGRSMPSLVKFNPESYIGRWSFKKS
ncbi:MAG: family 43 glycosylhydrolase [Desulfatiglans sp.]|nr:family 43 glycosylhydrolase [Desulfatiglans sp.]